MICPVTPMELPKVFPISMSRSPDIIPGIPVTNLEKIREGSTILPVCGGFWIVSPLMAFHSNARAEVSNFSL